MPLVRNSLQMIFLLGHLDDRWSQAQLYEFREMCLVRSWIEDDRCGLNKDGIVEGGFVRFWFEESERLRLYANHQGGYRVHCPHCFDNVARFFSSTVQSWRKGGSQYFKCEGCLKETSIHSCVLKPPGGFAHSALIFANVESASVSKEAQMLIEKIFGKTRLVFKRLG